MTTWYKASQYGNPSIEEVEVIKETPEFVVFVENWMGRPSQSKRRKSDEFFATREEAKASMIARYERELGRARDRVSVAANNLKQAREL